jgi:hypothetical protein
MSGQDRGEADPTAIVSIAVTVDDVVAAFETNLRSDRRTVLRITPPFSGRMRARIHRLDADVADAGADGEAIHLDPATLVADPPAYPEPDETADRLREAGTYSPERHHDRHTEAVDEWRVAVRDAVVDTVDVPAGEDTHRVEVKPLG